MGNELPKGWKIVPLKEITSIIRGVSYPKEEAKLHPEEDCVHILRGGNIQDGKIVLDTDDNVYVNSTFVGEEQFVLKDDVVIVASTGSKKVIGKAATIEEDSRSISFGAFLLLLRTNVINKRFHSYFFQTQYYRNTISSLAGGININNIKKEHIENLQIPLPPLEEQKQIAEKLDKLFDQIESIKKSTERIPELLKNFRQQILTYAVTGKLTEDYCNSLCYMDLQEIILQLKEQRINQLSIKSAKDKLEKIYSDDNSSLDFPIPKQWIPVNIDKICDSFTYGTSAKSENEGKYPVIRMGNIQNGKLDWSDLKYTSDESEYMKYKLNIGDILFNRTNSPELVGKTTIYDDNRAACYAGYIIKIDPYRKYVNPYYLNIVLNSQYAKRWCWENKTDGVSQSNINAQKISKFTIPYPSLSEQEEIVNRVQSLFDILDDIERRYKVLCDKLDKLSQAVLCKAFKGELKI